MRMRGNTEDIVYTRFGIFCVDCCLSLMLCYFMLMCVLLGCLVLSVEH